MPFAAIQDCSFMRKSDTLENLKPAWPDLSHTKEQRNAALVHCGLCEHAPQHEAGENSILAPGIRGHFGATRSGPFPQCKSQSITVTRKGGY